MGIENNNIAHCKWCDAEIKWLKTRAGKNMPINYETYTGELEYDHTKHTSHFATCPKAKQVKEQYGKKDFDKTSYSRYRCRIMGTNDASYDIKFLNADGTDSDKWTIIPFSQIKIDKENNY
ncbi:MAG: hypothetical protein WC358_11855, partial [Ignavibacteria bacterium]